LDKKINKIGMRTIITNKENYFTALQKIGEKMVEKYIQNLWSMPRVCQDDFSNQSERKSY